MRAIEIQQESDEAEVLELLIESDDLDGPAKGITKRVLAEGYESLSERQIYVFDRYVRPYFHLECDRCGIPMPTNEVVYCLRSGDSRCGFCICSGGGD